jgi:hypothetical protein
MRRIRALLLAALLALVLAACGQADDPPAYDVDYGNSSLYTQKELEEAVLLIQMEFATWDGCEMHGIRYGGDETCTQENLDWLNELSESREQELQFTQCAMFLSDFHSPVEEHEADAWNHDYEYTDWQWWLGRTAEGQWVLMTWGY